MILQQKQKATNGPCRFKLVRLGYVASGVVGCYVLFTVRTHGIRNVHIVCVVGLRLGPKQSVSVGMAGIDRPIVCLVREVYSLVTLHRSTMEAVWQRAREMILTITFTASVAAAAAAATYIYINRRPRVGKRHKSKFHEDDDAQIYVAMSSNALRCYSMSGEDLVLFDTLGEVSDAIREAGLVECQLIIGESWHAAVHEEQVPYIPRTIHSWHVVYVWRGRYTWATHGPLQDSRVRRSLFFLYWRTRGAYDMKLSVLLVHCVL